MGQQLAVHLALEELLKAIVPLLPYEQRWGTRRELHRYGTRAVRARMQGEEAVLASLRVWHKIEALPEYQAFTEACESDEHLTHGPDVAGRWGSPEWITKQVIEAAVRLRKSDPHRVDSDAAHEELERFRRVATTEDLHFRVTARILGVRPTVKVWNLPHGLTLIRLSQREINERERVHATLRTFYEPFEDELLRAGRAELRFEVAAQVSSSEEDPVRSAFHQAEDAAKDKVERFVNALRLTFPGRFDFERLQMDGDYKEGLITRSYRSRPPPYFLKTLGSTHKAPFRTAIAIAFDEPVVDRALRQAVRRFLLSSQRDNVSDAIVDLVIAWESLLLTSNGSAMRDELSYRFAVNGANLLHSVGVETQPLEGFEKLKSGYSVRSLLVHGGTDKEVQKKLKSSGFENEYELSKYLADSFRECLFYLADLEKKERPYRAARGWEKLMLGA